jgi:hypothetical protein
MDLAPRRYQIKCPPQFDAQQLCAADEIRRVHTMDLQKLAMKMNYVPRGTVVSRLWTGDLRKPTRNPSILVSLHQKVAGAHSGLSFVWSKDTTDSDEQGPRILGFFSGPGLSLGADFEPLHSQAAKPQNISQTSAARDPTSNPDPRGNSITSRRNCTNASSRQATKLVQIASRSELANAKLLLRASHAT